MSPTNQEALAIAELAYWTPALLLTLFISYKHGFGRQAGWILIALLALVRLTGSSCQVAYDSQPLQDRSTELITAAAICNLIGTSFVVSVFIGLLGRVREGMTGGVTMPTLVPRLMQVLILVSIVLSAVGGSEQAHFGDASRVNTGRSLSKAAIVLLVVVYLTFLAGLALVMTHMRHVLDNDRRLVYACVVSVPFVVVRLAYSLALAFKHSGDFSTFAPNVYVKAFMQVLMEFVVAAIVIAAGLVTDRVPRGAVKDVSSDEGEVELRQDKRPAHPKVEQ